MFVVAVTSLGSGLDEEAQRLAADLGYTPYEARLRLAGGLPSVVLQTPDKARALGLLSRLRARGHGAVACDEGAIVSLEAMLLLRDFRFDPAGISVLGTHGEPIDAVARADLLCLLRLSHRRTETSTVVQKQTTFSAGRAIVSGGLLLTKTKEREVTQRSDSKEQVLVLYRRGGPPLALRETAAHYDALGAERAPTTILNFQRAVDRIRAIAPHAPYDDRLVQRKLREGDGGIEVLAHLLAMSLATS